LWARIVNTQTQKEFAGARGNFETLLLETL